MTENEAIEIALEALRRNGTMIGEGDVRAIFRERHMRKGKNRCGWLVVVPLNVPRSFSPNAIDVEVYEPDGEVNIPVVL